MVKVRFTCGDGTHETEHCVVIKLMGNFTGKHPLLHVVAHVKQSHHVQFVHDSNIQWFDLPTL